ARDNPPPPRHSIPRSGDGRAHSRADGPSTTGILLRLLAEKYTLPPGGAPQAPSVVLGLLSRPHPLRSAELHEASGHVDAAGRVLEVLHDREHRPGGDRRPVERVHGRRALARGPVADLEPVRLVVGRVRARRDLAVALL